MSSTMERHSPHLVGALARTLPESLPELEQAFALALAHDAAAELDFEREEGVSFNPRPARIALILLRDAGVHDPAVLCASLLSCATRAPDEAVLRASFPSRVLEVARLATERPERFEGASLAPGSVEGDAAVISCCAWLDRMRHLHQATAPAITIEAALDTTRSYLPLASRCCPRIYELLAAWLERRTRNRTR